MPFPPLPAVLVLPLVMVFGLATDPSLLAVVVGAINVALAWRLTTRLTENRRAALLATLFFAFGTVHFYAAMLRQHLVPGPRRGDHVRDPGDHAGHRRRAHGGTARRADGSGCRRTRRRRSRRRRSRSTASSCAGSEACRDLSTRSSSWPASCSDWARLSRLTVIFGAPFFVFVGGGGSYCRRAISAGLGALHPGGLLLVYNVVSTGHIFNPAYEWLYQTENLSYLPPRPVPVHARVLPGPAHRSLARHRGHRPRAAQRADHVRLAADHPAGSAVSRSSSHAP